MRKWNGILFAVFIIFLFMEILIGFPILLEQEPEPLIQKKTKSATKEAKGKSPQTEDKEKLEEKIGTEQSMRRVHLVESRKGSRDWELFSESAEDNQGRGAWRLQKVKILFYNSEKVDFVVTGDKGSIDSESKNIQIDGNVVTKSSNGYEFQTQSIIYLQAQRILSSPDEVKMWGPPDTHGQGIVLQGKKLEANVDQNWMKIHENIRASKQLTEGRKFQIKSQRAEFSGKNRTARFLQDVSIDVGSLKMEGPEAHFEYRPGVDMLQSILVKGGVKVSDVDKYATSDSVNFDPEQNKFVFDGRPRVVQNSDEITGDQIVFIDGGKKVRVLKKKEKIENK